VTSQPTGRQLGRSGREKQGQGVELVEGVMDTEGGSRGVGMMVESEEAELVKGMRKVGSEGMSEVKAKGMQGPVAGEDNVMGGTKALAREVGVQGGVGSREEALNSSRIRIALLVGRVGSRVELLWVPVGKKWPINSEGEEMDVLGVEGGNDIRMGHAIATATKLCLRLLVMLVMSGNCIGGDMWR
jgi:hypothetical protein